MHTATPLRMEASEALIEGLRQQRPLADERLNALAVLKRCVLETRGRVDPKGLSEFIAGGFTTRHALDVVLGVGVDALTTYANRLTDAPLDAAFAAFRWEPVASG